VAESETPGELGAVDENTIGTDLVSVLGKDTQDFSPKFFKEIRRSKEVVINPDDVVPRDAASHQYRAYSTATGTGVPLDHELAFFLELLEDFINSDHKETIKSPHAAYNIDLRRMNVR